MKRAELLLAGVLVALVVGVTPAPAGARLPTPPETLESKAKAQEAAAKVAAASKPEAEELARRSQDKAAAHYRERQAK